MILNLNRELCPDPPVREGKERSSYPFARLLPAGPAQAVRLLLLLRRHAVHPAPPHGSLPGCPQLIHVISRAEENVL